MTSTHARCHSAEYTSCTSSWLTLFSGRYNRLIMRLRRNLTLLRRALSFFTTTLLTLGTLLFGGGAFALFAPRLLRALLCCATMHLKFGMPPLLSLGALSFGALLSGLDFL